MNPNSVSIARLSPLNPSVAITGSAGMDRGTPGGMTFDNKIGYDLTVERILMDLVAQFGSPSSIVALGAASTAPYLTKIRATVNKVRAMTLYFFEGGTGYGATYQVGRRPDAITLTHAANKRIEVSVEYAPPVGDSIAGLEVPSTANTGTFVGKITTRGRRAYDADYDNFLSLWLKVVSSDAGSVHLKAAIGAAATTPGVIPVSVTFGTIQTPVVIPSGEGDVFFNAILDSTTGLPYGIYGENFEPFEIAFGNAFSDLSGLTAGDTFEIPWQQSNLVKVTSPEKRLSAFHTVRSLSDGSSIIFDSGTVKLSRPYAPYFASGSKYSQAVDPTGDISAAVTFKKRLFDRYFRRQMDNDSRFACLDVYAFGDAPVPADITVHEGMAIYYPQMAVQTMKSGDVTNKNVLEESITLEAEQPVPAVPISDHGGFGGSSAFEINVTSMTNPLSLGIVVG